MSDAAAGEADEAVEPDDPPVDDSADEIRDEELPEPTPLEIAEAAREIYLTDLQRVSAEFANFRKQADKRNQEVAARARGDVAERLLPVLDACDLAISHGDVGAEAIRSALVTALEPVGLEVIDPLHAPFDPNCHEAVVHEPTGEGTPGSQVVTEVLRRGYGWHGRILRPAMVKVRG
ncbi:MAG: nucleotide exchange factor GrpE [Acidimicrobiales bacterium]|nr:nucleotide exchange factor GrpE [Acidimicrobiales bacterium]